MGRGIGTMVLDLTETGSGTTSRFDSGQVPGGSAFPRIDIDLSVNGFYCFDQAFYLHAAPWPWPRVERRSGLNASGDRPATCGPRGAGGGPWARRACVVACG